LPSLDNHVFAALTHYRTSISGPIHPAVLNAYAAAVEEVITQFRHTHAQGRNCIILSTPGGVVEAVEKMVDVTRHHFSVSRRWI
jgi:membrane-bound ClpP family serine protease